VVRQNRGEYVPKIPVWIQLGTLKRHSGTSNPPTTWHQPANHWCTSVCSDVMWCDVIWTDVHHRPAPKIQSSRPDMKTKTLFQHKSETDAVYNHVLALFLEKEIMVGVALYGEIVARNCPFWRKAPLSTADIGTKIWESVVFIYDVWDVLLLKIGTSATICKRQVCGRDISSQKREVSWLWEVLMWCDVMSMWCDIHHRHSWRVLVSRSSDFCGINK